jgi:hypothetical protein
MGKVFQTYCVGLLVLLMLIFFLPNAFAQNDLSSVLENAQKSLSTDSEKTASSPNIPDYKTYHNVTYGVKVMYPKDWIYEVSKFDELSPNTIFDVNFYPPIVNDEVLLLGISIDKLSPPTSLEEYKNRILTNMKESSDMKDISVSKDTLDGQPAYRIEHTSFFTDRWDKSISLYSVTKDKLYEVDVFAEPELVEKHSEEIKNMIQSVQFEHPVSASSSTQVSNVQQTSRPIFSNAKCGVSIQIPKDWKAEESQFVFEDKAKVLADFQSPDDDILNLQLSIENIGLAKRSPQDISRLERETASLADSIVLDTGSGVINGFPSYKTVYRTDKFHDMEILIIAFDKEYRLVFGAADKAEFDKYQSIIENMAQTIKISEPKFEGISC